MASAQASPVLRFLRKLTASVGLDETSDSQLLARFLSSRDEAAFAALVRRYGPMVLGVCRRVLCDPHDADDAFQATFLVLVRKAGSVGRPELLGNWLYGVAYRTALKARAAAARRHARERPLMDTPAAEPEAVWNDLRPILDEELNRLPQKYRVPVVLCYFEGKTHEEAAHCLGCPRETVSTRLLRARERLRARLTRRGLAMSGILLAGVLAEKAAPAAEIPAGLLDHTIQAATRFAAGQAAAGAVSAPAALAEGVLQAMFWNQLTRVTLLVAALVVGAGGVVLTYRVAATEPGQAKDAAPAKSEAKDAAKAPDDKEKLQGTWVGAEGERAGDKLAAGDIATLKVIIEKDRITAYTGGEKKEATFKLDPTQKPKAMDIMPQDGAEKGKTIAAIYSLEGDTLKLCFEDAGDQPRPTEFATKTGGRLALYVLRRQADDKGKDKPPAKEPDDKEQLQGTWGWVEAERVGKKASYEEIKGFKMMFRGDKVSFNPDGANRQSTFKLDPTQKPKAIDLTPQEGPEKDKTVRGIYSIDGDTLKLCFDDAGGNERPTDFTPKEGTRQVVVVLRRQADDKGKEKPPAKEPAKAADDKEKLQGTWAWVEAERGGKKAGDEEIKDFKMTFRGDKVNVDPGGDNREGTFQLDPKQKPKTIDLTLQDGAEKGKTIRGIYSLEGDTLKLCFNDEGDQDRPTDFTSKEGTRLVVVTLRRQADDKPKEKPPVKEPPEATAERQKLQGTWAAVSGETDGQPIPEDSLNQVFVIIKGDEIHFKPNRTENKVTFTLDPTKKPRLLAMTAADGPDKGKTVPLIYELEGDRLKLCFDTKAGEKQPTEFATKPGSGLLLFVLKRVDPSKMADREKLKGTWQAVSGETSGKPLADDFLKNYKAVFTEDKVKMSAIDDKGEATYTIDQTKKPKTIDIRISDKEKAIGIYELDGDTLKLCMVEDKDGNRRPTEFAGKDKAILIEFKRQSTELKEPEEAKK
jgi:RNA polymerase sigma factor (sigma-70 family)